MKGFWIVAAMVLSLAASPAWSYQDQDRARQGVQSGRIQPFSQIKRNIERQYNGRVLDVQLSPERGGRSATYDIKMLQPDGNVLVIETDAQTGRVLSVKGRR